MGRIKRAIDLGMRVIFVMLSLVFTFVTLVALNFSLGNEYTMISEESVALQLNGGAEASYTIEDGKLILDVTKQGAKHDDITVILTVNNVAFDTTIFEEALGDAAEEEAEFVNHLKAGPWNGSMHYAVKGESTFVSNKTNYIFVDAALEETIEGLHSGAANVLNTTDEMVFEAGKGAVAMFIMGEKSAGCVPVGKYTIECNITLTNAVTEDGVPERMSFGAIAKVFVNRTWQALKDTPITVMFKFSSLLTLYGVMILFGYFFHFYNDLRSSIKIGYYVGGATYSYQVLVQTFVNGNLVASNVETRDNSSFISGVIAFIISYMTFIFLVPIRTLIVICVDIYYIIRGDDDEEGFPIFANIFGTIGILSLVYALVSLLLIAISPANLIPCIIAFVVSIPSLILASVLSKRSEEYWD